MRTTFPGMCLVYATRVAFMTRQLVSPSLWYQALTLATGLIALYGTASFGSCCIRESYLLTVYYGDTCMPRHFSGRREQSTTMTVLVFVPSQVAASELPALLRRTLAPGRKPLLPVSMDTAR